MTVRESVALAKGSLIKARRIFMKANRWGDFEWYSAWPTLAPEWEAVTK